MSATTLLALAAAAGVMAIWWWRRRDRIVSENGVSFLGPDDPDMVKAIAAARDRFPMLVERLRASKAPPRSMRAWRPSTRTGSRSDPKPPRALC